MKWFVHNYFKFEKGHWKSGDFCHGMKNLGKSRKCVLRSWKQIWNDLYITNINLKEDSSFGRVCTLHGNKNKLYWNSVTKFLPPVKVGRATLCNCVDRFWSVIVWCNAIVILCVFFSGICLGCHQKILDY